MKTTLVTTTRAMLDSGAIVRITFTKKDGSERTIRGTRNVIHIPEALHPKGEGLRNVVSESVAVFDLDLGAWRSFLPTALISAEPVSVR